MEMAWDEEWEDQCHPWTISNALDESRVRQGRLERL